MSCICPTLHRHDWLTKAITAWKCQTYPNRELLILESGPTAPAIPSDPNIRLWHLPAKRSVGAARNFLNANARGEVIAHWDDDDYSAPARLADQVARLIASGRAVTGYHTMRFTDGERWWEYRGRADYALGTSLVYRRDWWRGHPFPDLRVGEDNLFVHTARARGQIVSVAAGELMHATNHRGNTSPRNMAGRSWRQL